MDYEVYKPTPSIFADVANKMRIDRTRGGLSGWTEFHAHYAVLAGTWQR